MCDDTKVSLLLFFFLQKTDCIRGERYIFFLFFTYIFVLCCCCLWTVFFFCVFGWFAVRFFFTWLYKGIIWFACLWYGMSQSMMQVNFWTNDRDYYKSNQLATRHFIKSLLIYDSLVVIGISLSVYLVYYWIEFVSNHVKMRTTNYYLLFVLVFDVYYNIQCFLISAWKIGTD